MQKTDLELQEAVIVAMDVSHRLYMDYEDDMAAVAFLKAISAQGYKIVKDTD